MLHICDYNIKYCAGCNCCLKEGFCIIDDDFNAVFTRLMKADGIIVGSPVYANAPTAQLKTLMDRMTLLNLYAATFHDKLTIGVATSGIAPTKGVAKKIAEMFGQRCGIIGSTTVSFKNGPLPLDQAHKPSLPLRANKMGMQLIHKISRAKRYPTFMGLWIHILRKYLLSKLVTRNPETFAAAIRMKPELNGHLKHKKEQ